MPSDHAGPAAEPLHPAARDFLTRRKQFRLDHLTTEQRHPATMDLSATVAENTAAGLRALWQVDGDVAALVVRLAAAPHALEAASTEVQNALRTRHRVLLYGCGSTGRLAHTLAALWRQFFARAEARGVRPQKPHAWAHLRGAVVGEITGGDRALISSLEGFEDLPSVGELQLDALGYRPGDVLFAVSEGGETSSVLGALAAARRYQPEPDARTFFVYNNPPPQLRRLVRSRAALDDAGITQLNLTTGPQAIAGSTRMQATTSELLVLGTVLEDALTHLVVPLLGEADVRALELSPSLSLAQRLRRFDETLEAVRAQADAVAALTDAEAAAYRAGRRATYRAERALTTVFTDATERSPTFRLAPLDPVPAAGDEAAEATPERRAWLHVASGAQGPEAAWRALLGRDFVGLDVPRFQAAIERRVQDADLLAAARRSLAHAGPEEGRRYDLSAASLARPAWRPHADDFLLTVGLDDEAWPHPAGPADAALRGPDDAPEVYRLEVRAEDLSRAPSRAVGEVDGAQARALRLAVPPDALGLQRHLAVKMLLNGHSTAVMCKLGRVVGNTMAFVQPSNLKLIGRATFLVQSHVNDVLRAHQRATLSYAAANSLLFEAIDARRARNNDADPSEVSLAIAAGVLRGMRCTDAVHWDEAREAVAADGLERFKRRALDGADRCIGAASPGGRSHDARGQ